MTDAYLVPVRGRSHRTLHYDEASPQLRKAGSTQAVDADEFSHLEDCSHCVGDVAEQDPTCENGTFGCPGPNAPSGPLPCSACFLDGGEER